MIKKQTANPRWVGGLANLATKSDRLEKMSDKSRCRCPAFFRCFVGL